MSSPDLPSHERGISPNEITIQYGEATLRISYDEEENLGFLNPSLTFTLGELQETIP